MPNKSIVLKLFTKEVILNSIPGLKEKIGRKISKIEKLEEPGMAGFEVSRIHRIAGIPAMPSRMPPEFVRPGFKVEGVPPSLRPPTTPFTLRPAGIDFGKLLPLIQNPSITIIECPGPNKELIIRTYNVRKTYPLSLTNEDMTGIVEQFSKRAKIPIINGLFRAWIDKFLISAIIMNNQVQNFILQKVIYPHFV